jgi:hypothetical protein
MNYNQYEWRQFLAEARKPTPEPKFTLVERRLLRELDEDEVEHVRDAIDTLGAEDLAFNDLFEGKTRLVLDFPTKNVTTDLGKFVDSFRVMGYDVSWEKGLVSGERELKDSSIAAQAAFMATGAPPATKKKKVQMKIGKFWAKIYELASKRDAMEQKVFDHLNNIGYTIGGSGPITYAGHFTGKMIAAALDEQEVKRLDQLTDQLAMYLGKDHIKMLSRLGNPTSRIAPEDAKKMQEYWQQNADYIKKNIGDLTENKYSIIVSRDPIDILRMSDFDRITSCHTPPSRGGGDSYYKCAVAEAHGHGAIAYVVETEDLFQATDTSSIESAEQEIQEGELFADDQRYGNHPHHENLEPVSRLRLRQVRAGTTDQPKIEHQQIAVPETRVYGIKIPGFLDRVFEWAKSAQAATIEAIPEDAMWIKYGGSYEDNNIKGLILDLTGRELERVGQNTETEDSIDDDVLLSGVLRRETEAVEHHMNTWNYRYQAAHVEGIVQDDGGGSIYVSLEAHIDLKWDKDEWDSLPTDSRTAGHWVDELNDYGWGWADGDSYTTRIFSTDESIILRININPEGLTNFGGQDFAYNADNFEDFCVEVNAVDDLYDALHSSIERMAKRDGLMAGGALNEWGREIVDGDYESYEWDMDAEEGYEYEEISVIDASHTTYITEPDGMSIQDARTILESRDFTIPVRKVLVEKAWAGTQVSNDDRQYPAFRVHTEELRAQDGTNIKLILTFGVSESSSDAQVKSMRWTVDEWDDEDILDAAIQEVFNQVVGENVPTTNDRVEDAPPTETTNESIVKNWKNFLYN